MSSSSHSCCLVSLCCCGCSLRTGSYIIGILSVIGTAWQIYQTCGHLIVLTLGLNVAANVNHGYWIHGIKLFFAVVSIISSIILIIGISKDLVKMIKSFVIVQAVILVVGTILDGIMMASFGINDWLAMNGADGMQHNPVFWITFIGAIVLGYLLTIYYMIVIRSYAISVEKKNQESEMKLPQFMSQKSSQGPAPLMPQYYLTPSVPNSEMRLPRLDSKKNSQGPPPYNSLKY